MIMIGELCPPPHTHQLTGGQVHTVPLPTLHLLQPCGLHVTSQAWL